LGLGYNRTKRRGGQQHPQAQPRDYRNQHHTTTPLMDAHRPKLDITPSYIRWTGFGRAAGWFTLRTELSAAFTSFIPPSLTTTNSTRRKQRGSAAVASGIALLRRSRAGVPALSPRAWNRKLVFFFSLFFSQAHSARAFRGRGGTPCFLFRILHLHDISPSPLLYGRFGFGSLSLSPSPSRARAHRVGLDWIRYLGIYRSVYIGRKGMQETGFTWVSPH